VCESTLNALSKCEGSVKSQLPVLISNEFEVKLLKLLEVKLIKWIKRSHWMGGKMLKLKSVNL